MDNCKGVMWRNRRRERARRLAVKAVRCYALAALAAFCMATEQAALWLTIPVLACGLGLGTDALEQLLAEDHY